MKKILIVALTAIAFSTNVFGSEFSNYDVFYKSSGSIKFYSLVRYLNVDQDQQNQLDLIFSKTEEKLKSAIANNDEAAIQEALNFNVGNAKIVLSEDQYKKYLAFVNLSLNDKLEDYIARL